MGQLQGCVIGRRTVAFDVPDELLEITVGQRIQVARVGVRREFQP